MLIQIVDYVSTVDRGLRGNATVVDYPSTAALNVIYTKNQTWVRYRLTTTSLSFDLTIKITRGIEEYCCTYIQVVLLSIARIYLADHLYTNSNYDIIILLRIYDCTFENMSSVNESIT